MGIVPLFASGINFGALLAVMAVVIGISVRVALLQKQGKTILGAESDEERRTGPITNKGH